MIKYLNKIFHPFINEKKILFLDSFEAHRTDNVIEEFHKINCDYKFIPPSFTSSLQPLDVCINKPFKEYYREEWNEWMDNGEHIYTKGGNRQKPSYQTLVDMVSKCLIKLRNDKELIKKSFDSCGIINKSKFNSLDNLNTKLKKILKNEDDWEFEIYYHNAMKCGGFSLPNDTACELNNEIIETNEIDEEDFHLELSDDENC